MTSPVTSKVIALTSAGALALGVVGCQNTEESSTGGWIRLLPGYEQVNKEGHHFVWSDITKPSGPTIEVDIDGFHGDLATQLSDSDTVMWSKRQTFDGDLLEVFMLRDNQMAASFQDATFRVRDVKTQEDVAEVLLMLTTYKSPRRTARPEWLGQP